MDSKKLNSFSPRWRPLQIVPLLFFSVSFFIFVFFEEALFAQGSLEGRINEVILALIRILNVIIVGFIAWSGFLIAKGDANGMKRLIYGIVGLITVNSAFIIINYFT